MQRRETMLKNKKITSQQTKLTLVYRKKDYGNGVTRKEEKGRPKRRFIDVVCSILH